jgi:hypothetical protein
MMALGEVLEIMMDSVSQGEKKRGGVAAYLEGFDVARSGIY